MAANLQDVIARLEAEIASAKATGSRIGFFASLYRRLTLEIKLRIDPRVVRKPGGHGGFGRGLCHSIFRCAGRFSR